MAIIPPVSLTFRKGTTLGPKSQEWLIAQFRENLSLRGSMSGQKQIAFFYNATFAKGEAEVDIDGKMRVPVRIFASETVSVGRSRW
jgi:hypothetical protein